MSGRFYFWENLSTDKLLKVRIADLQLELAESPIQLQISQLHAEIARKGLRFKPHAWISTSWFSPYGVPGFAIPFYLFHPRLAELEQKYIGEVEGGTDEWCMRLLRHESGHAIDNAFHLRKSKERQKLFGLSGQPYPKSYSPKPHSKNFVRHLKNNYAQAHPDEDWAETFAVWLDPQSNWHERYQGWGALAKLELADQLLKSIAGTSQRVFNLQTLDEVSTCEQTLMDYFRAKQVYQKLETSSNQRQHIIGKAKEYWITM